MGKYTSIDRPEDHFTTMTYTGDGSTSRALVNGGENNLKPDILWIKKQTAAASYYWGTSSWRTDAGDISAHLYFETDQNGARVYDTTSGKSFDTDGFTIGQNAGVNTNGDKYIAWQFKMNEGSLSTNSDGDVNTSIQVNSDAKISSGTYVGNGTADTSFGHGLGLKPDWLFIRSYSRSEDGKVYMKGAETANGGMQTLNEQAVPNNSTNLLYSQPTSSVFSLGTALEVNQNNGKLVFWAMSNVQGFSKCGSFCGNGTNDNGPFIFLGFTPSFVMIKRTDSTNDWIIHSYKLGTNAGSGNNIGNLFNQNDCTLKANTNAQASSYGEIDMLSNGFKVRLGGAAENAANGKYAYLAIAIHPMVTSGGVPACAV